MIYLKREFINYLGQSIFLALNSWKHIAEKHPEIDLKLIKNTLRDPDFVFMSDVNPDSLLYFLKRTNNRNKVRFTLVVVKRKGDGHWVSTAMTKNKIPNGAEIYRREKC